VPGYILRSTDVDPKDFVLSRAGTYGLLGELVKSEYAYDREWKNDVVEATWRLKDTMTRGEYRKFLKGEEIEVFASFAFCTNQLQSAQRPALKAEDTYYHHRFYTGHCINFPYRLRIQLNNAQTPQTLDESI
jgi:hypothetical protein